MGNFGETCLFYALHHNAHLLYLNLPSNNIGVEEGISLAKCSYFTSTSSNYYNKSGVMFQSKTVLRVLDVSSNMTSTEGAFEFGKALRYNTSLKELNLSDNTVSLEGILALIEGLEENAGLECLILVDNVTKNLTGNEMTSLVEYVGGVLQNECNDNDKGSDLEVLEMHSSDNVNNDTTVYQNSLNNLARPVHQHTK